MTARVRSVIGALAIAAIGLAGACSSDRPTVAPTASSPSAAPAPPAPPPRHACYDLAFDQATAPTSAVDPVPCRRAHTAATIGVGTVRPVVDGHLLAVDSDTVQRQIAARCRARLTAYVGGDAEARRLSRLTVTWFSPTLAESDRGAQWFRCDLVALAGRGRLAPLPRSARGILDDDGALDRFGTCGTASPAADRFARVICSQRHTWRARATIDLPPRTRYLARQAGAAADSACRDIESRVASDILQLKWSFEWPTREQWKAGQRYGYCWTPDPA